MFKKLVWVTHRNYIIEYVKNWSLILKQHGITVEIVFDIPKIYENDILYVFSVPVPDGEKLPTNFILHQKEQHTSSFFKNEGYLRMIRNSIFILEYSPKNKIILENILKSREKIHDFHFNYGKNLEIENIPIAEDIDVLFLGALNARREEYLQFLAHNGIKVQHKTNIFGEEKMRLIKRAKITVNIHYYVNPSILECERIGYLLANQKCVLSEYSNDTELDERYRNIVVFFENKQVLLSLCRKYLSNENERKRVEKFGYENFKKLYSNEQLSAIIDCCEIFQ